MKLYKFRPVRRIAKIVAKNIVKLDRFQVEIYELFPNIYIVNQTDWLSNGKKDVPFFLETKSERNP